MKRLLSVFVVMCLTCIGMLAQGTMKCTGIVVDQDGEPIIGASVVITGKNAVGTTDVDGHFNVTVPAKTSTLTFSFVGCKAVTVAAARNMGTITLPTQAEVLNDVVVTQSLARTRQTPVAVSQVNAADIEYKLGTQELPKYSKPLPASGLPKTAVVLVMPKSTCAASKAPTSLSSSTVFPSTIWKAAGCTGPTGQALVTWLPTSRHNAVWVQLYLGLYRRYHQHHYSQP